MHHMKWEAYIALCRKVETRGRNSDDSSGDPGIMQMQREFVALFSQYLSPEGNPRVLAPGCLSECVPLAEAGYEVHAVLLGPDNVSALLEKEFDDANGGSIHVYEMDAHDLEFPSGFFDGYFSIQFNEHLLAPFVHIGEVYYCMKVDGVVFVDAAGLTPEMKMIWHTNLVSNQVVRDQWEFWGFHQLWEGPHGDQRPQFVFQKMGMSDPRFRNAGYLQWPMRLRDGEDIPYDYNCDLCSKD